MRAQLRLEHLPEGDPARDALEGEADDLLARHEAEWLGPLAGLAVEWRWRRGCVERVVARSDALLSRGEDLFAAGPVRSLRLLASPDDLPRVAGCGWLASVEEIDLGVTPPPGEVSPGPYLRDRALLPLFVSPHLGRLRSLRLAGQGIEGAAVAALIERGLFARLERLGLNGCTAIGDRVARQMAESRAPALRSLHLLRSNLTAGGVRALLSAGGWPAVEEVEVNLGLLFARSSSAAGIDAVLGLPLLPRLALLSLHSVVLDRVDLDRLLSAPNLGPLRELRLIRCRLSGDDAVTLADSPALRGLRRLVLWGNVLFDQGARALAASPYLSRLEALDLAGNRVGGPGLRALVESLHRLTELDLSSGNHVGTAGAELLAAQGPPRLARLSLNDAGLGPEAARALASSPRLARLRALSLAGNQVRDEGVKAVAGSPHLARLAELDLSGTGLDTPGVEALLASPNLRQLRKLSLRDCPLSEAERERLRARFGAGLVL